MGPPRAAAQEGTPPASRDGGVSGEPAAGAAPAPCDAPPGDEAAAHHIVRLQHWGGADARRIELVVRELLERQPVTVCTEPDTDVARNDLINGPPAAPPPAVARVFIALRARHIGLYVVDGPWDRVLERQVVLSRGAIDEVAREEIGHIVLTSVEALLQGRPIGRAREELAAAAPPPSRAAAAASRAPPSPRTSARRPPRRGAREIRRFALGPRYRVRASGLPVAHELGVALSWRATDWRLAPLIALRAEYVLGRVLRAPEVAVSVYELRAGVEAGARMDLARGWGAELLAGVAVQTTFVDPQAVEGSAFSPRGESSVTRAAATASLAAHWTIAPMFSLALGLDAVIDVVDVTYAVHAPTEDRTVADPWSVRPSAWVGLDARL